MKLASQMAVLVTIAAVLLPFTIGAPTKLSASSKFVQASDPSQKTGGYIVILKDSKSDDQLAEGSCFINVMLKGTVNFEADKNSGESIVKTFKYLGFSMFSVDMNEVALEKVLECNDVELVEETQRMSAPDPSEEEEEDETTGYGNDEEEEDQISGYGDDEEEEDGMGQMIFAK